MPLSSLSLSLGTTIEVFIILVGIAMLRRFIHQRQQTAKLPPGPKGLPLIGNLLDMPSEREWLTFAKWGEQWGDICSVTVVGQPIIILNSAKAATEILDKKGSNYSNRPVLQMGGELTGWKDSMALLQYGDRLRRFRRMFHIVIGTRGSVKKFELLEEKHTKEFLQRVLRVPNNLDGTLRHLAGSISLRISHGYEVKDNDDPFIELAETALNQFSVLSAPGSFLVDVLPILRYVPSWFPGAGFQRLAKLYAPILQDMVNKPYEFTKTQVAAGVAPASFTSMFLEGKNCSAEEVHDIKWSGSAVYGGGADTTVAAVHSFFLAMILYPKVAKKAQQEIDTIIGNDRLPTFEDRPKLPYINALVTEVLRWHTVAPLGIPHCAVQDDIHDGYLIPKGALVIANIWQHTHDPATYPDPFVFNPERFIATESKPAEVDPRAMCFGYGRRVCPGYFLADSSIFIACAMVLAVFNIDKGVENGVVVEPIYEATARIISHPKPFKYSITTRSDKAAALIHAKDY